MTNLDREDLRRRLKTIHESQGVPKSTAMKLMQELDETEAKWRKEWGRANTLQGKLDKLKESYLATLDTYGRQDFMFSVVDLTKTVEEVLEVPPIGEVRDE